MILFDFLIKKLYLCSMKFLCTFLISLFLLCSCDLVKYHPYELTDDTPQGLTASNISLISQLGKGRDTIHFVFMTDTQRDYTDTREAVDFINSLPQVDFVLHGGDQTDFGLADEFRTMSSLLCGLKVPFLTVIGNHDFLGTAEYNYASIYGPYNWSLNVGHTHLLGINSNALEAEDGVEVPDYDFLNEDIQQVESLNTLHPDSITQTIILSHARPGDLEFFSSLTASFLSCISQYPGLNEDTPRLTASDLKDWNIDDTDRQALIGSYRTGFAMNGHNHHHELLRVQEGCDFLFFGCPNIKKREVYYFTLYPSGFRYESLAF